MISFRGVGVTYSGGWHALKDVTFEIERGEFTYVTGKSGAGKSTLLRLIYADLLPSRGVVAISDNDITSLPKKRIPYLRRQIGVVFQDFKLLENYTVFDNVKLALDIFYLRRSRVQGRIWQVLNQLGIFEKRDVEVCRLSGGEKQRVAIARALINEPAIILADEPTGNLDNENADIIMSLLKNACASGATVLCATHDTELMRRNPARILHLKEGKLAIDGRVS